MLKYFCYGYRVQVRVQLCKITPNKCSGEKKPLITTPNTKWWPQSNLQVQSESDAQCRSDAQGHSTCYIESSMSKVPKFFPLHIQEQSDGHNLTTMPDHDEGQAQAVAVKPPAFQETSVPGWFSIMEAQFHLRGISSEKNKFIVSLQHYQLK